MAKIAMSCGLFYCKKQICLKWSGLKDIVFPDKSNARDTGHRDKGDFMAFTFKTLKGLGLEEDKIDLIMDAHNEVVKSLKEDKDKYKADSEKLADVQRQLDEAIKKNSSDSDWKKKFDDLTREFEDYKTDQKTKADRAKKAETYKALLEETGVSDKRIPAIMRVTELDKIELDDDGKIKNAEELKSKIAEEWSDFITSGRKRGTELPKPPKNDGGSLTKEEILKIKDPAKRQKAIAENMAAFGY